MGMQVKRKRVTIMWEDCVHGIYDQTLPAVTRTNVWVLPGATKTRLSRPTRHSNHIDSRNKSWQSTMQFI